jgi:hypothetical protein
MVSSILEMLKTILHLTFLIWHCQLVIRSAIVKKKKKLIDWHVTLAKYDRSSIKVWCIIILLN